MAADVDLNIHPPLRGAAAIFGARLLGPLRDLLAHRELIENLVARDIKARYKQSTLGIAWAILNPLVMALIYAVVGAVILKQNVGIAFAVFSYFGLLWWNLFSMGVTGATESLVTHLSLITKVYFPREVFPIATVLSKLVDFGFGLVGMLPLLLVFRTAPSLTGLLLTMPLLLILLVFASGLGMLLACANLFNRDVRHVAGLLISVWMWLVPNLYPLETITSEFWRRVYLLNPVAALVDTARKLVFPQLIVPSAGAIIHWKFVVLAAVVSVVTFALGYIVFKRNEPRFAESV
jgi:ABC-type polysaccharide/polyol phosphate export permease